MTTQAAYIEAQRGERAERTVAVARRVRAVLVGATRIGGEADVPEGTRYIQISDSLARALVVELDQVL